MGEYPTSEAELMDIHELTQRCADHLAKREVKIVWRNPPSESAAGQVIKTHSGDLVIYIGNLNDVQSRFKVYLHELAHCRLDADFIPISDDHTRQAGSVKQSQEARAAWRGSPREKRAQDLADLWLKHAERNAYKYWRVDRSEMECRLRSLLDWSE